MNKLGFLFFRPVYHNLVFFLWATLLHTFVSILCALRVNYEIHPVVAFIFPIWDAYLLCLLAELLSLVRLGRVVKISYIIIALCEIFCCFFYDSVYNVKIIRLILETTPQESGEFLNSILLDGATWWTMLIGCISLALAYVVSHIIRKTSDKVKRVVSYIILPFFVVSAFLQTPCLIKIYRCYNAPDSSVVGNRHYRPYLYTPIVRIGFGIAFNHVESMELVKLRESIQRTTVSHCSFDSPNIVLIIGESFNKYHTPLYNPNTVSCSPRLERLRESGNLVLYNDVVTTSNLTSVVFRYMFGTWSPLDSNGWTDHTLFPVVFREAGYDVVFMSNQFQPRANLLWNTIGGTIFNDSVLSEAQFTWRNMEFREYDADAVQLVPDSLIHSSRPTIYIYHLYGQHIKYSERYPQCFAQFTDNNVSTEHGGSIGRHITAEYANATLYNDYVVDSIWSLFSDREAVGIYLSDHGEEVYDWRSLYGRTDDSHINAQVAKYQFEIPFMFLLSDTYKACHREMVDRILEAKDTPYQNSRLPNTLFTLAGIATSEYHASEDILSDEYDPSLPRPIGAHDDYDKIMQTN